MMMREATFMSRSAFTIDLAMLFNNKTQYLLGGESMELIFRCGKLESAKNMPKY